MKFHSRLPQLHTAPTMTRLAQMDCYATGTVALTRTILTIVGFGPRWSADSPSSTSTGSFLESTLSPGRYSSWEMIPQTLCSLLPLTMLSIWAYQQLPAHRLYLAKTWTLREGPT